MNFFHNIGYPYIEESLYLISDVECHKLSVTLLFAEWVLPAEPLANHFVFANILTGAEIHQFDVQNAGINARKKVVGLKRDIERQCVFILSGLILSGFE